MLPIQPQNPPSKAKLFVATPMYGGMCTGMYSSAIMQLVGVCGQNQMLMYFSFMMNESLITRARNELARVFLEQGHDYLMFVDADIHFDGEAVAQLLLADKDIVCGIYPKKEVNWTSVKKAAVAGKSDLEDYAGAFVFNMAGTTDAETDETGCIEVRHGGTGFMLIKRGVFEELIPHVPTYRVSSFKDPETGEYQKPLTHEFFATSIDESGALLSEDYHFCELWRNHGGKIHAHPFIKLYHVGTYVFGGDILQSGGNLK
jgi:hypothetical protein